MKDLALTATAFWALSFFWLRLAQLSCTRSAFPYLRTVIFSLGDVTVVGLFWNSSRSCSRRQEALRSLGNRGTFARNSHA